MPKELDGAEAWRRGYMRKDNPFPLGTISRTAWDVDFMDAMGDYYDEELSASMFATRKNLVDKESFQREPPTVCGPVLG